MGLPFREIFSKGVTKRIQAFSKGPRSRAKVEWVEAQARGRAECSEGMLV